MPLVSTNPPPVQGSFTVRAKMAMLTQGTTITDVAIALSIARTTASQCINHNMHEPTRLRIAKHLGIAP